MNYLIDIIIVAFLLFGFIRGFLKGFFDEISYLISLVFSIYGAIHFSYDLKILLDDYFSIDYKYNTLIAFFSMLIILVCGMAIISKIFTKLSALIPLGKSSKFLGGMLGLFKLALLLGIALNWLDRVSFMVPIFNEQQKEISVLSKPTKKTANIVFPKILDKLDSLKNLEKNQREKQEKEIQDKEYYKQQKQNEKKNKSKTYKFF